MSTKAITVIDEENFENPFRTTFEFHITIFYFLGTAWMYYYTNLSGYDLYLAYPFMLGTTTLGIIYIWKSFFHYKKRLSLFGKAVTSITLDELEKQTHKAKEKNEILLGQGFEWNVDHRQIVYEIQKVGINKIIPNIIVEKAMPLLGRKMPDKGYPGSYWIHGVNFGKETRQAVTVDQWTGNSIFLGTTRAGKSVALRYLVSQAIMRDEVTIVIDPKGDKSIENTMRKLAERQGKPFYFIHTARTEESVRIDLLKNWNRISDLASRIASLIPALNPNDPFTAFSWKQMNAIFGGFFYINEQPTLMGMHENLEGGVGGLLKTVLEVHMDKINYQYKTNSTFVNSSPEESSRLKALIQIYKSLEKDQQNKVVGSLIGVYLHPDEHAQKMIGSLVSVLEMLTSDELGPLLSPDPNADDPRPIVNMKNIVNSNGIVYVGLDALSSSFVAGAVGSLFLSDLTSLAGSIYNEEEFKTSSERKTINIFVDELSLVINEPFLAVLGLAAGAGFKSVAFTQTLADLTTRLGSKDAALKALGNFNNKFALRSKDLETLQFIADELPMVSILKSQSQTNTGSAGNDGDISSFTGGHREGVSDEEVELFPPNLLPSLPNMEYLGIVAGGRTIKGRVPLLID